MKSKTKYLATAGVAAICAASMVAGVAMLTHKTPVYAADENSVSTGYYYDTLTIKDSSGKEHEYTLAKKFYEAFDEMNRGGDFKDGKVSYSLTEHNLATPEQIKAWVENGDVTVPKAFSAARDCYIHDHPEVFYIDFYKLTISAARTNGAYTAYIDSGREANAYRDGGFSTEAEVNSAITAFNARVKEIVDGAKAAAAADAYDTAAAVVQARYVNKVLAESIEYDYGALDDYLATGSSASSGAFIESAYGGLIAKKAVCSGYSNSFKVIMDELGIPCVVVKGYSQARDGEGNASNSSVPHAWNYVQLEDPATGGDAKRARAATSTGKWYGVDVTWNSGRADKNAYMLMSSTATFKDRTTDGIVSSSGYELKYPSLSSSNYGSKSGAALDCWLDYVEDADSGKDDYGNPLMTTWQYVSYNGKSALRLTKEDGLRIAFRNAYYADGVLTWTDWTDLVNYKAYIEYGTQTEDYFVVDDGIQTKMYGNTSILYTQYAVIGELLPTIHDDLQPDTNLFYDSALKPEEHMEAISDALVNKSHGTYTPAPYVTATKPIAAEHYIINDNMRDPASDKGLMADRNAPTFEITYDEELHVLDDKKPIGVTFTAQYANTSEYARFIPFSDGSLVQLSDDGHTLKFRFAPSLMYEHNQQMYIFSFTNVGSAKIVVKKDGTKTTSDKLPNPVPYVFARSYMACPNVFGDGRLWVDCCAQPTLLDNSDLSEVDFKNEDGTSSFSAAERSQMLLVVDKVDKTTEDSMLDAIDKDGDIGVNKDDILKSETYSLDLQICGKYPKIPDGSYVKIALGFPEGYGPDDEGVTFKIFHRKHIQGNEYIVEEIPCVVTKYGIVASVTSFSPYMVAVVPADKVTDKTIYASVEGKGGKLNNADGQIQTVAEGKSYTYTISPDEGYKVYRVTLNGNDVTERVANGKLTVNYDELSINNEVEIQYIANEAAVRFEEQGIVDPVKVVLTGDYVLDVTPDIGGGDVGDASDNTLVAVILVTVAILVVAAAVIVTLVLVFRKKRA